jgi:hypothetical protein
MTPVTPKLTTMSGTVILRFMEHNIKELCTVKKVRVSRPRARIMTS